MLKSTAFTAALVAGSAAASAQTQTFIANMTPDQVVPLNGAPEPVTDARGFGTFVLDQTDANNPTLSYSLNFFNFDVASELQAVHFHFGAPGDNGPHVLNVFGLPREDDADMMVTGNTITGIWDDGDANNGPDGDRDNGDSIELSLMIDSLITGQLYVQVHSFQYPVPDAGELRGQIVTPEPATLGLVPMGMLLLARRRR